MRALRVVIFQAVILAACFDGAPTFPEAGSVELESTPLLSGGEGVLISSSFAEFDLDPRLDEEGAVVPRRWENSRVEVDRAEVDSWRIDPRRVGFRVPVARSGTYAIEISGPAIMASLSEKVLGGSSSTRLNDPCMWSNAPQLIPVGPDLIWSGTLCVLDEINDIVQYGYASMHPSAPGGGLQWIEGANALLSFVGAPTGAGQSYAPGRIVFQRPASFNTNVETDIWTVGSAYEQQESIRCLPAVGTWTQATIAEVAPGVCVAYDHNSNQLFRNGEEIGMCCNHRTAAPSFRVSGGGVAALKDVGIDERGWPILNADGIIVSWVNEYTHVTGVAFSVDASRVFVTGEARDGSGWILDVLDARSGDRIRRAQIDTEPISDIPVQLGEGYLWLARKVDVDGIQQLRLERWNPETLEPDRSIAVPPPFGVPSPIAGTQVEIIPGAGGRRAHLVGWIEDNVGVRAHTVDFE